MAPLLSGGHNQEMCFIIINFKLIGSEEVSHGGVLPAKLLRELLRVLYRNIKSAIISIAAQATTLLTLDGEK